MYMPFTAIVILLVFTSAFSAPTARPMWNKVKESSIKLNTIAKNLHAQVANDLTHVERNIKTSLALVQAKDKCDPANLRSDSKPCIEKIAATLKNYSDIFEMLGQFNNANCKAANNAKEIVEELGELHYQLKGSYPKIDKVTLPNEDWRELEQCLYSVERLFSFSILTARVFALGDPAQHIQDSTVNCRAAN